MFTPRPSHATPWRQKRNSFQQIGFANTIRPGQNNSWRRKLQLRPTIVAKIINHQFRQP
jgi:hypothetical protein